MKQYLIKIPEEFSTRVFLSQEGEEDITYGDIDSIFSQEVVAKIYRKVVCCICTQTSACVAGFLALEQVGSIPLMLGKDVSKEYIDQNISIYDITYMWMPVKRYEAEFMNDSFCVILQFRDYVLVERNKEKEDLYTPHQDLALLLVTSGSTGEQKFARISKENINVSIKLVLMYGEFNETEVALIYLPMEHCYANVIIHALYSVGAHVVCEPEGVNCLGKEGIIDKYKISVLPTVSFIVNFLRKTDFFNRDYASLKKIINAAGATPRETQEFLNDYIKRQGGRLILPYGQTEMAGLASGVSKEDIKCIYNSIGKPLDGVEMTIENEDSDGVGELVIHSANVMMGYASKGADLELGNVTGNILHTGDLAKKDENGFFYIIGRIARFAKLNGERISLQFLEEELVRIYHDKEFACISNDKDIRILTTVDENQCDEVKKNAAKISGVHAFMIKCIHRDQIPRNERGKIEYHKMEKMFYKSDEEI